MTITCKKIQGLSSLEEIKGEMNLLDDKCEFIEIKESECVELVEKCMAKKRSVLDLYHIGKQLSLARIERKWNADLKRDLLESGITY